MNIYLKNLQNNISIRRGSIQALAAYVIGLFCKKAYTLNLVFVDNAQIKKINTRYLGKACATDVIAFGMQEGAKLKGDPHFLGDIFISAQKAAQNAASYGNSVEKELAIYVIHGILHLLVGQGFIKTNHRGILTLQEEVYTKLGTDTSFSKKKKRKTGVCP